MLTAHLSHPAPSPARFATACPGTCAFPVLSRQIEQRDSPQNHDSHHQEHQQEQQGGWDHSTKTVHLRDLPCCVCGSHYRAGHLCMTHAVRSGPVEPSPFPTSCGPVEVEVAIQFAPDQRRLSERLLLSVVLAHTVRQADERTMSGR
jgi:hypothetical protein